MSADRTTGFTDIDHQHWSLRYLPPWMRPYDPIASDTTHLLQPPSPAHPFGTDAFGRDVLSCVLLGGRPTLLASLSAVILATAAGLVINYWHAPVNIAVWISIMIVVIVGLNILPVKFYGETEFWFAG